MKKYMKFCLLSNLVAITSITALPNTYFVTNTNDDGSGSLRSAITAANSHIGADEILFNIPNTDGGYNAATGVWTIQLASAFQKITDDSTTINGVSQTLNKGNTNLQGPEIELNGADTLEDGFIVKSSYNVFKGLVINRFTEDAILIDNSGHNLITGNYIGTDVTGTMAMPNGHGIILQYGSKLNVIGGSNEADRNLISGNEIYGIFISNPGSDSNTVIGNYIGTDITGELALGNTYGNIFLKSFTSHNIIGGAASGEGNVISGATTSGNILAGNGITLENASYTKIFGNFIGTNKNGTTLIANDGMGIVLDESPNNTIGGNLPGERNIIGWNNYTGILVQYTQSSNNVISGNFIGTNPVQQVLNNSDQAAYNAGIIFNYGASDNTVGPSNTIAKNIGAGITVNHDSTLGNTLTQNLIFDVSEDGISTIGGGNTELSPPVINEVSEAMVSGTSCPDCIVELFSTSTDEAETYEGSTVADGSGNFGWNGTASMSYITATATDTSGNTSQLSSPFDNSQVTSINSFEQTNPRASQGLLENFPNPFSTTIEIHYVIDIPGIVSIKIYDMSGKWVTTLADGNMDSGEYYAHWDGKDSNNFSVPEGIYLCKLVTSNNTITNKIKFSLKP